ncbi:MAG: transposase [Wenzhouxiangella sp.]
MTYPRCQIAPPGPPGFFHVISRCVRRAYLCGLDRYSGRNFDHRRQWIEDRIRFLAESFAVSVYAYAVMSNHFHIVMSVDPNEAAAWSDEEVARRWLRVFPGAISQTEQPELVHAGLE